MQRQVPFICNKGATCDESIRVSPRFTLTLVLSCPGSPYTAGIPCDFAWLDRIPLRFAKGTYLVGCVPPLSFGHFAVSRGTDADLGRKEFC